VVPKPWVRVGTTSAEGIPVAKAVSRLTTMRAISACTRSLMIRNSRTAIAPAAMASSGPVPSKPHRWVIAEACRVLEFPIVSGNVSLYNETNGRAIPPTPAIGGVGLIEDRSKMVRGAFAAENERILLIGAPEGWGTHLGRSAYLRELHGLDIGPPPPVDLEKEKLTGAFVRALIGHGVVTAVHDLSDGGLAVALAEMAIASGIGARVNLPFLTDPIPIYFGEDQGRYLVTISKEDEKLLRDIGEEAQELGLHAPWIGETGGDTLNLFGANAIPVAELKAAHESWFPGFMDG
jgi:phosphoribosylformylglycinamidine synthase